MNTQLISILIFLVVMLSIVTEKINRTVAAISGAVLMIITNVLTLEESISHIDFNTYRCINWYDDCCISSKKFRII